MRWIKHPSSFSRTPAMYDVRDTFGSAGYGAAWLMLERIAETWDGTGDPELCLSLKEWCFVCGLSVQKFRELVNLLQNHGLILTESVHLRIMVRAPILLQLQDEWTSRQRKNSRVAPDSIESHSGQQTDTENKRKEDKNTQPDSNLIWQLAAVLRRHGIMPGTDRAQHILEHIKAQKPNNPGGYLQRILERKPDFDPGCHAAPISTGDQLPNQYGPCSTRDILRTMGLEKPP